MIVPLLRLDGVSLTFTRGDRHYLSVLAKASLDVQAGELIAVFASRAEGKSTLLRVAAGFDRPDDGRVLFDGEDLWRAGDRRRSAIISRQVAFVQHRRPDLDLTARELLSLPLMRRHGKRTARMLADKVLLEAGISECGTQRWDSMADHERIRLTLARGIACGPRLLLIDDLMNALSVTDDTARLLRTLADERFMAVVLTVSDMHATAWCDRVVSLAGGKLIVADEGSESVEGTVIEFPADPRRRASP